MSVSAIGEFDEKFKAELGKRDVPGGASGAELERDLLA